jgi:Fe-S oxidoreductase
MSAISVIRLLGAHACSESFSFEYSEIAEATSAHTIVSDNQGCIMHLRYGCDAGNRDLNVKHIAEVLAERVRADPSL